MAVESLKNTALNRISKIVDQVFEESEVYREEIDKAEFLQYFSELKSIILVILSKVKDL